MTYKLYVLGGKPQPTVLKVNLLATNRAVKPVKRISIKYTVERSASFIVCGFVCGRCSSEMNDMI